MAWSKEAAAVLDEFDDSRPLKREVDRLKKQLEEKENELIDKETAFANKEKEGKQQ